MNYILVVDDQISNLSLMVKIINESAGNYSIYQATNGEQAIGIVEKKHPDLIVMDWDMPGMSGIETIEIIRQKKSCQDIPIIICTGIMTKSEDLQLALQSGAIDYIRKPIDSVEFLARINSAITLSEKIKQVKENEKEIEKKNEELRSINSTKDKFFNIIAHDLKNSINALIGFANLLYEDAESYSQDDIKKFQKHIYHSSKHIYNLLENLLQWSRNQNGTINFEPIFLYPQSIISSILELFSGQSKNKKVEIVNKVMPEMQLKADSNMLSTIFRNVISNAIKFSYPNSKIYIDAVEQNEYIEFSVKDFGVGISDDERKKLFSFENRSLKKGTENEEGTGLGLILASDFTENHKGHLWISSSPEKGTTVFFSILKDL